MLHVWHHFITSFLCFWCLTWGIPSQWSGTFLNAVIHIPMYWYYFLVSMGYKDIWWKKYITVVCRNLAFVTMLVAFILLSCIFVYSFKGQIIQFVMVIAFHGTSFYWHYAWGGQCSSFDAWWKNVFGMGVVTSYLLLFIQFYFRTYTTKSRNDRAKKE